MNETLTIRIQTTPFGLIRIGVPELGQALYLRPPLSPGASQTVALADDTTLIDDGQTAVTAAAARDGQSEIIELHIVRRAPAAVAAVQPAA